jgi:bifunctional DNA-binding transcriptional regulator/antitoxin component of YhaV-PrlF toxin-antitoxin module
MICTVSKGSQITIPAEWRNDLGFFPEKKFYMEKRGRQIIIEPLCDDDNMTWEIVSKMIDESPESKLTPRQIVKMVDDIYG